MAGLVDITAKALLPLIEDRIYHLPKSDDPFASQPKEGKVMIFIGGGNGSGKTSITRKLLENLSNSGFQKRHIAMFGSSIFEDLLSNPIIVGARHSIAEFMHDAASSVADNQYETSFAKKVALRAFCMARDKVLDRNLPIVIDYHMHDSEFVKDCVKSAQEHGYETVLISPHVDLEIIKDRLETRKTLTGKPYNMQKIETRHQQFAAHLDEYLNMFDLSLLLDNNHTDQRAPSIIAVSHRGNTEIFDSSGMDRMRSKARPSETYSTPPLPSHTYSSSHVGTLRARNSAENLMGRHSPSQSEPIFAQIERSFLQWAKQPSHSR